MKKALSVLLAALLCFGCVVSVGAAADAFEISNPYAGVDWTNIHAYKTALHSHTNASDGSQTLVQSVERHVETGFDIVAITDHGTVDYTWEAGDQNHFIKTVLNTVGRSEGEITWLGSEGTFPKGVGYTYKTLANGDQFLFTDTGRTVMKMPYGIENNAVSVNAHVNSWFADYADNSVTTYEDALAGVDGRGGLCVINHPGEYTKARYEIRTENAYNEANPSYAYYINKYAYLIEHYDGCLGIDMNSKGDGRTRFDRKLWDILLSRFSANGENLWAICSSDAHQLDKIDTGFALLLMPALSSRAAFGALQNGQFFGASHCLGNYDELLEIGDALAAFYGASDPTCLKVRAVTDAMREKIEGIESGKYDADDDIGITYSVLDDAGYTTCPTFPAVASIAVDDAQNTISVHTENALLVRFISEGKTFAVKMPEEAVVDLDDYAGQIGNYVRAEVFGEGGVLYTQAFLLNASANAGAASVVKGFYMNIGFLDFLFAVFHNWGEILIRYIRNLF